MEKISKARDYQTSLNKGGVRIMEDTKREEFNLITIYGNEVRIITDTDTIDDIYEEMEDSLDANNIYYVGGNGEKAIFKGHELSVIDFKKIIGRD